MDGLPLDTNNPSHQSLCQRTARFVVQLGIYDSKKRMLASVRSNGYSFSRYALYVINYKNFVMLGDPGTYEFVEATVKEVTGKNKSTTAGLCRAMRRLGFIYAPYESAPAIREVFADQRAGESRAVLSKPLENPDDGEVDVLSLNREGGRSLVSAHPAHPSLKWNGDDLLLLCRKSQSAA